MPREYGQIEWDELLQDECRRLVQLAVFEDLQGGRDWTTEALVASDRPGKANIVSRQQGVIAGLRALDLVLAELGPSVQSSPLLADGAAVNGGQVVARLEGPARELLTSERLILNLLGRLSGVATNTRRFVRAIGGTTARVFDTRKTTPGWRRLEKYAVRCGGGNNHRIGLFDAVLIKDNHLALGSRGADGQRFGPGDAVRRARQFLAEARPASEAGSPDRLIVEIEVDRIEQFEEAIGAQPDIILLDNFGLDDLRQAVSRRNRHAASVKLEASGGIGLDNIRAVAMTGVDCISVGALTHGAVWLDLALDWDTP